MMMVGFATIITHLTYFKTQMQCVYEVFLAVQLSNHNIYNIIFLEKVSTLCFTIT